MFWEDIARRKRYRGEYLNRINRRKGKDIGIL